MIPLSLLSPLPPSGLSFVRAGHKVLEIRIKARGTYYSTDNLKERDLTTTVWARKPSRRERDWHRGPLARRGIGPGASGRLGLVGGSGAGTRHCLGHVQALSRRREPPRPGGLGQTCKEAVAAGGGRMPALPCAALFQLHGPGPTWKPIVLTVLLDPE